MEAFYFPNKVSALEVYISENTNNNNNRCNHNNNNSGRSSNNHDNNTINNHINTEFSSITFTKIYIKYLGDVINRFFCASLFWYAIF